jgi:hypothetical protein
MSDYTGGENGYTPLMGASSTPYDVSNTPRHEVLNFEGTPTQFSDETGLKALLTRNGIMDVSSFNPIAKEGEKITADTPRQATNSDGQLLFLDANGEQTTRPTGTPMVGGTIGDAAYMKEPQGGGGAFGPILSDFKSLPKDELFKKFLLTAAAIGTGGLAANALGALGALTPVAEAFPVSSGALLPGTELGAVGSGALEAGGVGAGGAGSIGLTDAEASALMGEYAPGALGGYGAAGATGLTLADALKYAKMGLSGAGLLGSLIGGGSGVSGGGSGVGVGGSGVDGGGSGGGAPTINLAALSGGNTSAPAPLSIPALTPGMFMTGLRQQTPVTAGTEHLKMLFPELDPALARQFAMSGNTGSNLGGNYFAYGSSPSTPYAAPLSDVNATPMTVKNGGAIQSFREGGAPHIPEFITGATGHYVKGRGDGQSDDIPAMLADGEYVFDADTVAQLGNGSSDAGAKVLDKMREALRHHKRSAPVDSIPPKAKSPLEYIKLGMKRK